MIYGAKGKGGKSKGGKEDPDNLQSTDIARVVDILGEGPIKGLARGDKSIYLDDTQLQADDGSYNFQGIRYEFRPGDPDQLPLEAIPAIEEEVSVGATVSYGTPIIRTIEEENVDAARIKIRFPQGLSRLTDKGDLKGTSVQFAIDVRNNGGAWQEQPLAWRYTANYAVGHYFMTNAPTSAIRGAAYVKFGPKDNQPRLVQIRMRKAGSSDAWVIIKSANLIPNQGTKIYDNQQSSAGSDSGTVREPRGGRDK